MARRSDQDAAADALYAQVPDVNCKGHCRVSCTVIDMSHRERARIREQTGVKIPPATKMLAEGNLTCPALSPEGSCTVYEYRPMICRVWGATEGLPCQWGCELEDGKERLTNVETYRLIAECNDAGGGTSRPGITRESMDQFLAEHGPEALESEGYDTFLRSQEHNDYARANTQYISPTFANAALMRSESSDQVRRFNDSNRPY